MPGPIRITDQVIEEVDEQMTIQSTRAPDKRPTAQSLFKQMDDKPARSAPIDVPGSFHNNDKVAYDRVQSVMSPEHLPYVFPSSELFSSSAPEDNFTHLRTPKINVDHVDDPSPKLSQPDGKHEPQPTRNRCDLSLSVIEYFNLFSFIFCHTHNSYDRGGCGCEHTNNNIR